MSTSLTEGSEIISFMTFQARTSHALPFVTRVCEYKLTNYRVEGVQNWREILVYFLQPIKDRDYSMWPDKPEGWRGITEEYSVTLMGLTCKLLEML